MDASRGVEVVREDAQPAVSQVGGSESESDTISVGVSVGEAETVVESPIAFRGRGFAEAFASLDSVDLKSILNDRAHVMRSIPFIMKGAFRCALEEVTSGIERHSDIRVIVAAQTPVVSPIPRRICPKEAVGGTKCSSSSSVIGLGLLNVSQSCSARVHQSSLRRRRRDQAIDVEKRAARALSLVKQGELSSARMALEGAEVAPGNLATLRDLTNLEKRPPRPRRDLSQEVVHHEPAVPFALDEVEFLVCLRQHAGEQQEGPLA